MIRKVFGWLSGHSGKEARPYQVGGIFGKVTPEAMCELDLDTMDREAIKAQLAKLYKRHNQAAGSLNPGLREEAEVMLDAITHCREKYVDVVEKKK